MTSIARGRTTGPLSNQSPARAPRTPQPTDSHGGLRMLALAAVAAGVLLLAAAAFVLSYAGIHAVALSAGVSARLARIYPLIFDAMLVVASAAVLSLRGAGLPSRSYAWLSMLVLLAAAAAADALHATGTTLPRRPAAAAVAIIPWVLVLIGFGLLLCMLRQARLRRAAAAARPRVALEPSGHVEVRRGTGDRPAPMVPPGQAAAQPVPGPAVTAADRYLGPSADAGEDLAIDADTGQDDPANDEARPADLPESAGITRDREEQPAGYGARYGGDPASALSPAPTMAPATKRGGGNQADAGQADAGQADAGQADAGQAIEDQTAQAQEKLAANVYAARAGAGPGTDAGGRSARDGDSDQDDSEQNDSDRDDSDRDDSDRDDSDRDDSDRDDVGSSHPEADPEFEPEPVSWTSPEFDRMQSSPTPPSVS